MSTKTTLLAGAANFASLLGRGPVAKAEEPDDKKKPDKDASASAADDEPVQGDDESDEDFEKRKKAHAEDKKRDDETDDEHQARAAANADARARKAKQVENGEDDDVGDDSSDDDDMKKKGIAAARQRERARCMTIMGDKAVANNPGLAFQLAFGSSMSRGEALGLLRSSGKVTPNTPRGRLADVMRVQMTPSPGPGGSIATGGAAKLSAPEKTALEVQLAAAKGRGDDPKKIEALETKLRAA
jgi:hypothetical protein